MWLVGGIYGCSYNVEVWLVGVVVRRYIDILIIMITFPNSTCISSFFGSSIPVFFILTRDEQDFFHRRNTLQMLEYLTLGTHHTF